MPRCDDPQCGCQPYPRKNRKVEVTLRGDQDDQVCELHQPGASIDLTFDIVDNALILHETINDPTRKYTYWKFTVKIKHEHMEFENLIGLPDGSLRLSLRLTDEAASVEGNMMEVKEKISGFAPRPLSSKLDENLYQCDWASMRLEIFMPEEKIVAWKTVALITKTFKRITSEQWSRLVWLKNAPPISSLNWISIESQFIERKKKEKTCLATDKGMHTPPPNPPSQSAPVTVPEKSANALKPQNTKTHEMDMIESKLMMGGFGLGGFEPQGVM